MKFMRTIPNFAGRLWSLSAHAIGFVLTKAESVYHLTIVAATIVAGIWTYHLFISERNSHAHLALAAAMTISTNTPSLGERRLVFLDVVLTNTGKRKVVAKKVSESQVAYQDPVS